MLKKVIQRYAVAFGMAAAMFAAGAGGIQKANAAEIADQAGSVQESETVRQSETPQESEMQRQPETTQQSETTGQSETLPLKNVKKAPKLDKDSVSLKYKDSDTISVINDVKVTWESSNPVVASVDSHGNIIANKKGTQAVFPLKIIRHSFP